MDQLEVLWTQAQRLNRLIDTFVDLSHIERGEFEINLGKVELLALLRAAVTQAVGQARTGHTVETEFSDPYIWVHGDGRRLEQVFTHVISNGIKYSPPGQPVLLTARLEPREGRVVVDVIDRGPGIPQHLRKDIFERSNPGDAQRSGGLGVGLFLTRTVVEAHGGHITLQSSPTEGTTVTIILPV
jgi:signal transduction histidine kinase